MRAFGAVLVARPALAGRVLQHNGHPIWPAASSCQLIALEHSFAMIAAAQSITTSHTPLQPTRSASTASDHRLTDPPKAYPVRMYMLQALRLGMRHTTKYARGNHGSTGRARELDVRALQQHKGLNGMWRLSLGQDMVLFALDSRAQSNKALPSHADDKNVRIRVTAVVGDWFDTSKIAQYLLNTCDVTATDQ